MQQLAVLPESEPVEREPARECAWDAVLRAVRIESSDAYEIAGRLVTVGRSAPAAWPGHVRHPHPLVERLSLDLYENAYAARIDAPGPASPEQAVDESAAAALSAALSEANDTAARWDAGWVVEASLANGGVAARKGDRVRVLLPGEFHVPGGRGVLPAAGAPAFARVERESRTMQPGFWFAFGSELGDGEDEQGLVRLYWNVRTADDAPHLVRALTRRLNRFEIPFRFKCPVHPAAYRRIDAAVLYVARRHYRIASWLLADVHAAMRDRLDGDVPLLTKRLAYGLGLAEDPGGGDSFGTHRCRILAEALWDAHEAAVVTDAARSECVRVAFRRHGLDPDHPHLGPRSRDVYDFPPAQELA